MASEKKTDKFSSFSYIATNPTTGVVRGELRASGQDSALIQLERMGLEPISVSEKKQSILDSWKHRFNDLQYRKNSDRVDQCNKRLNYDKGPSTCGVHEKWCR